MPSGGRFGEYSVCEPVPGVSRMIDFWGGSGGSGFPTLRPVLGFSLLFWRWAVRSYENNAEVGSFDLERLDGALSDWF